jgi:hypothetical protein
MADGEVVLRATWGMGEGTTLLTASWRSSRASPHRKRWSSTVVSSSVSAGTVADGVEESNGDRARGSW